MRLAIVGDAEELLLAGAAAAPPGVELTGDPAEADAVITLGASERPPDARLWLDWPAAPRAASADAPDRLIAPGGERLWGREPWPVNDGLFELEPPAGDPSLLVVYGDDPSRERWAAAMRDYAPVVTAERLTRDALTSAHVVAMPSEELPAAAFAVLAARRLLITGRLSTSFGLLAGVDHLEADGEQEAAQLTGSAVERPGTFRSVVELGALAAERRRASRVYSRLATDLGFETNSSSAASS